MAPAITDVSTQSPSIEPSETLFQPTKTFPSDNTHYRKRISLSYLRRLEQNPDRTRKDGTPVYSQSIGNMRHNISPYPNRPKPHCLECNSRHKRFVRKSNSLEMLEETSLAYNMSFELPSDRQRKKSVLEAVRGLHAQSAEESVADAANLVPEIATESDYATAVALRDLYLSNDTSMERGAEFNFNYLVPSGPEFVVKQSKPKKSGKGHGKRTSAKARASKPGLSAVSGNGKATTNASSSHPLAIFKWETWLAAAAGFGAMVSGSPHDVPETVSDHGEDQDDGWDLLSVTYLDETTGENEDDSAETESGHPGPWVVLNSDT
ncbi:hypothetical protein BROUX41_004196 [Berkeleyomyces rouxiae]|uniref:uncharacterized protein n=1 Tax=Berkeleyomyces rouxiae TaxID=2035830 RepID=UPI003B788CB8